MRATGWHNGGSVTDAAGYGIKFSEIDRDRHFDAAWDHVIIELEGAEPAQVSLLMAIRDKLARALQGES